MGIVETLESLQKNRKVLSDGDRVILYNSLLMTPKVQAEYLYIDLCYMYLCITSGEQMNKTELKILKNLFSEQFVRGLVDVGTFMEKLEDIFNMDETQRIEKWKNDDERMNTLKVLQKQNSDLNASWSQFLFESREINRKAYEVVKKNITHADTDWNIVIMSTPKELIGKSPLFYNNIKFNDKSILEKRAMIYKYAQIYNVLPNAAKQKINEILIDIYNNDKENTESKNDVEVIELKKKSCCSIL